MDENSSDNSIFIFNDSKISNSPLMENSSELSQGNIDKYLQINFRDVKLFDLSNFPRKRNYQESYVGNNPIISGEEKNSKKYKTISLMDNN